MNNELKIMDVTIDFFGKKATDKVTGFTGTATAVSYYMYGCEQVCLTPGIGEDGKTRDQEWFDIGRLEFHEQVVEPSETVGERAGCDHREHGSRR